MRLNMRTVPILLVAALVSCGGTESPTDARMPVATTLTVSPTSVSFSSLGDTEQFRRHSFRVHGPAGAAAGPQLRRLESGRDHPRPPIHDDRPRGCRWRGNGRTTLR